MSLWGNKDSKTATGTVAIAANGAVTGTSTAFTTESRVGDFIRVSNEDYRITVITSDTAATVVAGVVGATLTSVGAGASYTLSEKPKYVSDPTKVFGVDTTEAVSGGDNIVSIAVASGGLRYLEAPTVTISGGAGSSGAATASIAGGLVSSIAVSNTGTGYTSVPTVVVDKPRRTIPTSGITTATDTIAYTTHGLNAADVLVYNNGGGSSATGLTSGTTYYVISSGLTANAFKVSATDGGSAVDITGTGNNAQYFEIQASTNQATAISSLGDSATSGTAHAGWVLRTVGTGGRAGRVNYETLVAMGTIAGDQADDTEFKDS